MKKYSIEIKWALYFILMTLLWMLLEKLSGLHGRYIHLHMILTNLIALPAISLYVLALREKKLKFYNGEMNYKQSFVSGLIITLIVTVFSPVTQLITTYVITPEYFPNVISYAVSIGYMGKEEAELYFSINNYIIQGLIGAPVMGLVTTAIVSIFVRSRKK